MSKLLLVEDDETIVENLCVFLQQEGFLIESVSGQKHAVELLEEKNYFTCGWQWLCNLCLH